MRRKYCFLRPFSSRKSCRGAVSASVSLTRLPCVSVVTNGFWFIRHLRGLSNLGNVSWDGSLDLKNIAQIEYSGHWSFNNFIANALSAIAAYCFFEKKPVIGLCFVKDGQLTMFWTSNSRYYIRIRTIVGLVEGMLFSGILHGKIYFVAWMTVKTSKSSIFATATYLEW